MHFEVITLKMDLHLTQINTIKSPASNLVIDKHQKPFVY